VTRSASSMWATVVRTSIATASCGSSRATIHWSRSSAARASSPPKKPRNTRSADVFLLCSDGLTSMIREDQVREILEESESLKAAVDRLVEEANRAGGRDNITVVSFRLGGDGD